MFPVMFRDRRTSGWIAQWKEMIEDPEQKIARPRQIYTGERDLDYVPIGERDREHRRASFGVRRGLLTVVHRVQRPGLCCILRLRITMVIRSLHGNIR